MEALNVTEEQFESFEGINDFENFEDNISKRRRARKKKKKAKRLVRKKKRVARRKKIVKRVKKTARKVGRTAKRVAKKVGGAAKRVAFAPLLPLKAMMVAALKRTGTKVTIRTPIDRVANLFYNNVVRKQHGFEDYDELNLDSYTEDNIAPIVAGIVEAIITFVKRSKEKKQKGEKLTKVEQITVTGTETAEANLRAKAEAEAQRQIGEKVLQTGGDIGGFIQDNKIMLIAVGAVIVFLMIRKK